MKNLLITLSIIFIALTFTSCAKNGIHLSSSDLKTENYWVNQSRKIVHRNQKYAKMEKKDSKKEDKQMKKYEKVVSKGKVKSKRLAYHQTFDFH